MQALYNKAERISYYLFLSSDIIIQKYSLNLLLNFN